MHQVGHPRSENNTSRGNLAGRRGCSALLEATWAEGVYGAIIAHPVLPNATQNELRPSHCCRCDVRRGGCTRRVQVVLAGYCVPRYGLGLLCVWWGGLCLSLALQWWCCPLCGGCAHQDGHTRRRNMRERMLGVLALAAAFEEPTGAFSKANT